MENQNLNKYEDKANIKITENDFKKFYKDKKLSFSNIEEIQGFLYKYGKEYLLELEMPNGSKPIIFSHLNIKKIHEYEDEHTGVSTYAYKLITKTCENMKNGTLQDNLTKLDIEYLLTELSINQRKQLLFLIDENPELQKKKTHKIK